MRKPMMFTAIAALAATPALAQGHGGLGASPPIIPPDQTGMGPRTGDFAGEPVTEQRDEFGRPLAGQQGDPTMERVERYRERSQARRMQAQAMADAARAGRPITADAAQIRQAFQEDMEAWRDTFRIGRSDWQQQRQLWIDSRGNLSASQWATLRADWFTALDAWIEQQVAAARTPAR